MWTFSFSDLKKEFVVKYLASHSRPYKHKHIENPRKDKERTNPEKGNKGVHLYAILANGPPNRHNFELINDSLSLNA